MSLRLLLLFLSLGCSSVFGQTCLQRAQEIAINGAASAVSKASIGYGVGNWYRYNDQFRQVILGNQWSSFGHIGAEVELSR